jgi:hypothetical protein
MRVTTVTCLYPSEFIIHNYLHLHCCASQKTETEVEYYIKIDFWEVFWDVEDLIDLLLMAMGHPFGLVLV